MLVLYPTETVYGLGVNPFDEEACAALYALKGRDEGKPVSWLLASSEDIASYAEVGAVAQRIITRLLPGPLTIVLPVRPEFTRVASPLGTIGFRVSNDQVVQRVLREYGAPLTATSANVSGEPTLNTVSEILAQFGDRAGLIDKIIEDGPRSGTPSTVVRVLGQEIEILREGAITREVIIKTAETLTETEANG